ncbi:UPF0182 family protein [Gemmatimonas sp.]
MGARGWLVVIAAATAVVLLVGRTATALYVDHAWFEALGAPTLFWEQLLDTALLQGGAWVVGSLFAFANLHAVRTTILAVAVPSRVANLELTAMVPGQRLRSATVVLSLLVGGVLALPLTNWETLALVRHGVPFEEIEGIFGRDLGHYVYWLPFEETMYLWSLVSVVALTAMVLVLYALTRSLRLEGRRVAASTHVRRHLSVLGALVLMQLAWSYRLDGFDLLLAGSGTGGMFLRVDHIVTLRMDAVLSYGSAVAALIVLRTGWTGQLRAAFVTLTAVLVAAVLLRHAVPTVLARGDTLGDAQRRDADYVAARALYSRRAYDVDAIRSTNGDSLGSSLLPTRTATLADRLSLWDDATLGEGLGLDAPRPPRASTDDRPTAAADNETPRGGALVEVASPGWLMANGRVAALRVERPVASVGGWRTSLIDATRPAVRDSVLDVGEPTGSADGSWPLVAPGVDGARVLDITAAADVPGAFLDTPSSRVAHAWALRDPSLLRVDSATNALLVTQRDVRARVRRLAPIFEQGSTIHPVVDGPNLYWAVQLYSASDRYPMSQRWQVGDGVYSYFKLAATALVDATTGRVRLIPVSKPDAIARTWMTRLPRLFTPGTSLSPTVAAQLPPASDAAIVQLRTFARYGSRVEGSVLRHLPDSALVSGPPAPLMLESGATTVPAWSVALLDDHDAVAGVATVTGGVTRTTFWSSAAAARPEWPTMLSQLRSALDRSAPGGTGDGVRTVLADSSVRPDDRQASRGRLNRPEMLVTSRGMLLVQAARTTRADGRLAFGQVAVTDGRQVGVGPTVAAALTSLGETLLPTPGGPVATAIPEDAIGSEGAGRWYDAMRQAMKQGNWSAFGAAFDSLGRALGRPPQ